MNQQNVLQYSQNQNGPFQEYGTFKWLVLIKVITQYFQHIGLYCDHKNLSRVKLPAQ